MKRCTKLELCAALGVGHVRTVLEGWYF